MTDLTPGSDAWNRLMTASKVAAALGVSPWQSPRSLWHQMRGELPREPETDVMKRGHYLEPAILAWWSDQHPEYLPLVEQPSYALDDWAAATPDALAVLGGTEDDYPGLMPSVLVEAKSVANDDDWGDEGTDVIPAYYLTQVYWAMHVSRIHRTYVPIITGRLRFAEYVVDYDPAIGADLERRMHAFYDSLSDDVPPPLDNTVATFDAIRKLHPDIDADETVEVTEAEAVELLEAVTDAKVAADRERLAKATVLDHMGRANHAACNGVKVARRQPGKGGVSFYPLPKNLPLITNLKDAS